MKAIFSLLFVLFGLLQYQLWFSKGGVVLAYHLQKDVKKRQQHQQLLEARNHELLLEIQSLKQGQEALESHARYDLGMVGKDEIFYQIVPASFQQE